VMPLGVSGGDEQYVRIEGLGITGAFLGKGTCGANTGIKLLELTLT
jgi:hypothetical protein